MLGTLVESSHKRVRRPLSTIASISAHVIVLAAAASAARPMRGAPEPVQRIIWHPPPGPPPVCAACVPGSDAGQSGQSVSTVPALPGPLVNTLDVDIPTTVGPSVVGPLVSAEDWTGGFSGDSSSAPTSILGREGVDREVVPLSTNPAPRYPASLRAAGIQGSVFARFVVDTTGRVRMETVKVDVADHSLFAEAVMEALRRSRYTPAELRGRKVPQLVVQPFVFVIRP